MKRGPWIELILLVAISAWVWDRYSAVPEPEGAELPVTAEASPNAGATTPNPNQLSDEHGFEAPAPVVEEGDHRADDDALASLRQMLMELPGLPTEEMQTALDALEGEPAPGESAWYTYKFALRCQGLPVAEDLDAFVDRAREERTIDGNYIHDADELEDRLTIIRAMRASCDRALGDSEPDGLLARSVEAGYPPAISARFGQVILREDPEMAADLLEPLSRRAQETCSVGDFAGLGTTAALAGDVVAAEAAFLAAQRLAEEEREHRGIELSRGLFPFQIDADELSAASLEADRWMQACSR